MFMEKNGKLYLTKGDSASMTIDLFDASGLPTAVQSSDVITLTVKDRPGGSVIFAADNNIVGEPGTIEISGAMTSGKKAGYYSADIQLERSGKKYTIWPTVPFDGVGNIGNFIILPEVTE